MVSKHVRFATKLLLAALSSERAARLHAICAEHGEVVEQGDAPALGSDPRQAGFSEGSSEIARTSGHDHCLTAQSLRTPGLRAPPPAAVASPGLDTCAPVARHLTGIRNAWRILHDSPKASPPPA